MIGFWGFFVISALLKIPDEILLHLSVGLLAARTPRTLFPKDKEGECVLWLVFMPDRVSCLTSLRRLHCFKELHSRLLMHRAELM